MNNKYIFLIILAGLFVFSFPYAAHADVAPGIYITDLKVNEIKNNQITGEFTVFNSESYYLNDLNYEIKLLQGATLMDFKLIDTVVPNDLFFATPGQSITKTFTYTYPKNIVSGQYDIRLQAMTSRGTELGWADKVVSLTGANNLLEITLPLSTSKVLYKGKNYGPLEGVNILPKENVVGLMTVVNSGDAITVIPHVKIFQRMYNMPLIKEYDDSPVTFAKGETKNISLNMPQLDTPESYLAEIKFYQNNQQVSGIQYFRWVVKGEGGKIIYVETDKGSYKAGESMILTVSSIGPADGSDIGKGNLQITVSDKSGKVVATTSKEVLLNSSLITSTMTIPVESDLVSPVISVELAKPTTNNGENVLDQQKINLSAPVKEIKQSQNAESNSQMPQILIYLISVVIILIIIFVIIFLIYKLKFVKK